MTDKTPDQIAADDALAAAIDQVAKAYDFSGLITGWILTAATLEYVGGDDSAGIWWHSPGGQSWVTSLGLIEALRFRYRAGFVVGDDT